MAQRESFVLSSCPSSSQSETNILVARSFEFEVLRHHLLLKFRALLPVSATENQTPEDAIINKPWEWIWFSGENEYFQLSPDEDNIAPVVTQRGEEVCEGAVVKISIPEQYKRRCNLLARTGNAKPCKCEYAAGAIVVGFTSHVTEKKKSMRGYGSGAVVGIPTDFERRKITSTLHTLLFLPIGATKMISFNNGLCEVPQELGVCSKKASSLKA
ncbi:predicted protein [Sclerotinia sclerotiorum 1980 UF-70]|uniref:Uncharacterized protein n=1 Tax=Sclerotinia sclerotiorum (strain ATCC 18683 / 1980 / Ss-1) TaxID=665079 RepID=A7F6A8_SCLS1|nr:predicted protein [Sclerotinia sclerotiorum 1980 UF-70]EDN98279.1 predicted protein [Sclerotinia sclerotiorum 1980 UF-70]